MTLLPDAGDLFAGAYRVEGKLGRGGHGAVFRAQDLRRGGVVALKLLLPEQLDGVGRDRFRREAELGERMVSPHSVRLFAHGEDEHGQPYIAFELLEGQSLGHFIEARGVQPVEVVLRVARAVLDALAEAHELGMVHRDIKPANIFLCQYAGSSEFVKVLDFGIAKRSGRDATQLTEADVVIGTARYMAPEQLRGEEVSPATDLYSLGLLMAEMLVGQPVFLGSTIEVCLAQVSGERVPLPDAVRASPLGPAIERATAKDPARRYGSARAMLAALAAPSPRTLIDDPDGETVVMNPELQRSAASSPVLAAVPISAPPISATVHSAVPTSSPAYMVPTSVPPMPSHPSLYPIHAAPPRRASGVLWGVGLVTALLLLAALVAAGAWLVSVERGEEPPPPMPSAR